MKKNIFMSGFSGGNSPFDRASLVPPLHFQTTRAAIEADGYRSLRNIPLPKGWAGTFPYIIKVGSEGEYIVNADGTAQWLDYHNGQIGEPVRI
jgi:hypothetical protein